MPTTTRELITKSWYLSSIVARDIQTVEGSKLLDGLDLLNSLLAFKTADQAKIPYYDKFTFTAITDSIPGTNNEKYFIPGLIECETLTFTIGTVRYSMSPLERKNYFGRPRANNVASLPYCYHIERCLGGSNLFMYYLPSTTYPFEMYGSFSLNSVTIDQDLSLTLDKFYIEYLRYLLAAYMCEYYEIDFPNSARARLEEYENLMIDISPQDFSLQKLTTLSARRRPGFYGMANLGVGYIP
jgi:hypothetical protein